jgi:serine/threonine protein phosphatase PrpC
MRKSNSDFKASFVSEPGTFITNKGYYAFVELDDIACWIAADGLDSDEEKESAKLVVHRIFEEFVEKPALSRTKIKSWVMKAHELLQAESRNIRLKAGFIMLVTDYSQIVWAMAGNLRLYHFRKGIYSFRTKDQSIAQLMVDSGKIVESELNEHDERNNLVNYVGKSSGFKPFVSRKYRLRDGDVMVLCNSGFWENMTTEELSVNVRESKEVEELVDNLEDALLGKQNEVLNNYSIAAVYANKVFQEKTVDYKKVIKRIVAIAMPLLLMLGIGLLINRHMVAQRISRELLERKKIEMSRKKSVADYERNADQMIKSEKYQEAVNEYRRALNVIEENNLKLPKQRAILVKKYNTTLLIVDGDNFTTGGEFSKALAKYSEAVKVSADIAYDKSGLMSRIGRLKNCTEMKRLVQQGDNLIIQQKFSDAKEKYQLAKNIAEQLGDDNMMAAIESKLISVEQKRQDEMVQRNRTNIQIKAENTYDTQMYQAKRIEKSGDDKYNLKDYKEAVETYQMARRLYEGLGANQDILLIDAKIKNAEKKSRGFWKRLLHKD